MLLAIGNMYVETNYLGLETGLTDTLVVDREYRSESYEIRPGGSAVNFAIQAAMFGFRVGLIGKIGADENGQRLKSLLAERNIATDLIVTDGNVQTGIDSGLVFTHSGKNIQVVSGNANLMMTIDDINLEHHLFSQAKAVYLGGFLKQEHLYPYYPELVKKLRDNNLAVFFDHGRIPVNVPEEMLNVLFDTLPYVTGYLPNRAELTTVIQNLSVDHALEKAAGSGPEIVAVKLDRDGAKARDSNGNKYSTSGYDIKPLNVVGAGDVFNAGFVTSYLSGTKTEEALEFANASAAFKINKNRHPSTNEVKDFIRTVTKR